MLKINSVNNGNCLDLMNDIDDKSIDMILCDLPYGVSACKWDSVIPFEPLWAHYKRIIKNNGAIVLTASQPFTSALVMSNIKMFKYCWVWEKPQGVDPFSSKYRPLNNIEDIVVFCLRTPSYCPQMEHGEPYDITRDKIPRYEATKNTSMTETRTVNTGARYPKRIIRTNQQRGLHPTQKPVALFEYLIKTYTNEGELVLDNCAGSGTTAIACLKTNRNYILIEQETKYCDIANKRIAEFTP